VVVAGDEDRRAPALPPPAQLPVHRERPRDLAREGFAQRLAAGLLSQEELGPQEEAPPLGSEEYWWEETMLASRPNRKPDTAATMPGRSGQETSSRPV
jgi:hypothetical protein